MSSGFDPYREWLDLDRSTGPPDHYRLLGLSRFESNVTLIMEAADRRLSQVRGHRPGIHTQAWAQLLDQISAAKACLVDAALRADYDRVLMREEANAEDTFLSDMAQDDNSGNAAESGGHSGGAPARSPAPIPANVNSAIATPAAAGQDTPAVSSPTAPVVDPMAPTRTIASASPVAPAGPVASASGSPVPGFDATALQTAVPGFPPSAEAAPARTIDPMAPLDVTAVPQAPSQATPLSSVPAENAPIPGFANVAPQVAPAAVPGMPVTPASPLPVADPIGIPQAAITQPAITQAAVGQPATAKPAFAQPVSQIQSPLTVASPPVANSASPVQGGEPPPAVGSKRSAAAIAKSRAKSGILIPVFIGGGVGLGLLIMGGLYVYMGGTGSGAGVNATGLAQADPDSTASVARPADANVPPTGLDNGPSGGPPLPGDSGSADPGNPATTPGPDPDMAEPGAMQPGPDKPSPDKPSPDKPSPDKPSPDKPSPPEPGATEPPPAKPPTPEPPQPTPPTPPSRAELVQLSSKLKSARAALAQHDFAKTRALLESAEPLALLDPHKVMVEQLWQLNEYAGAFHQAILDGTSKLQAGESLQVKNGAVGIVETSADRVVLRVGGMNKRYALSNLPLGLAVVLAHQAVAPTDPTTIAQKACYVVTSSAATAADMAKARAWFVEAAASLPNVAALADVMNQDYDLVDGVVAPAVSSTAPPPGSPPPSSDPTLRPTRAEVGKLAAALSAARKAIAARDTNAVERHLTAAEPLAKLPEHQQKLWRLQRLAEHVGAFDQALREAVAALAPGDVIKVGSSTELTVQRINPASIAVEVAGLKKTYPLGNPPLGLAVALVQTKLSPDDPVTKAIQAAFVVVSKNSDDRSLAKARIWYEESAAGNPDFAALGDVIDDDYNLLRGFQE